MNFAGALRGPKRGSATLNAVATVLVASDLASLRHELRSLLAGPDLEVEEATTGPEVLDRVRDGGVDLVILDL